MSMRRDEATNRTKDADLSKIDDEVSKKILKRLGEALMSADTQASKKQSQPCASGLAADNVVVLKTARTKEEEPGPSKSERWPLPGLAPMTRVRTIFGDVHSIALRQGDEVLTKSGEYLPIQWINRIKLDEAFLARSPDSHPVVIGAGALGKNEELMVSPRQVISEDAASGLSTEREAAMLVSHAGVRRLRETGLTYTLFHVGEEASVMCEGLFLKFPMEA